MRITTRNLLIAAVLASAPACESKPDKAPAQGVRVDVERYQVELYDDDYALGGDDALVTIVVFSDYGCGPCKNLWQVMRNLHEDYGDDIRIVARTVSVKGFEQGESAVEAAYAAGAQGKFWPMHWRLFEHQEDLSVPVLRAHAKALGLDTDRFNKDLDEGAFASRKLRDRRKAKELGVIAAPIVFVNGMVFVGPKPDEAMWHQLIDAEITTVREQLAAGMARKGVYAQLQSGALAKPLPRPKEVEDLAKEIDAAKPEVAPPVDLSKLKAPEPDARYAVPLKGAYGSGPEDAPVVIVEFTDFQCPFCRKLHVESLAQIREKYADEVRVVTRHLPLEMHRAARGAAKATLAAGKQGRFLEFHDRMFERNEVLGLQTFKAWAADLGMDVDRFVADFNSPELEAEVSADRALCNALGLKATPSVFVNGRFFEGFLGPAQFEELIAKEKAAMAEAGVAPKDWYAHRMQGAKGPDEFPNPALLSGGAPNNGGQGN